MPLSSDPWGQELCFFPEATVLAIFAQAREGGGSSRHYFLSLKLTGKSLALTIVPGWPAVVLCVHSH